MTPEALKRLRSIKVTQKDFESDGMFKAAMQGAKEAEEDSLGKKINY